jgi:hypothetical protein
MLRYFSILIAAENQESVDLTWDLSEITNQKNKKEKCCHLMLVHVHLTKSQPVMSIYIPGIGNVR